jgi:hypothetical protein
MISGLPENHPANPSVGHLLARLRALEARVAEAVARRRTTDPAPDDPFRGLYVSHEAIDHLLAEDRESPESTDGPALPEQLLVAAERGADDAEAAGAVLRLRRLQRLFGLDDPDIDLLTVAVAPDVDRRFEQMYGYLNDDVTRRRATIGLALELCGSAPADGAARSRLLPGGPLASAGLLLVEDDDRPVLGRSLRVPDRVTSHLLGSDRIEPELQRVLDSAARPAESLRSDQLERALAAGAWPIYLREAGMASGAATAAASIAALGTATLTLDLALVAAASRPEELVTSAVREARLVDGVLLATGVDIAAERASGLLGQVADARCPTVLVGMRTWDPAWSSSVVVQIDAPVPRGDERRSLWESTLADEADPAATNGRLAALLDAAEAFKLTPPQVRRAARSARLRALVEARSMDPEDLQAGARAQNTAGLERLARRVEPRADWADLVLPPDVRAQLEELSSRARHRERVLDEWGVGGRSSRGRGITALFAGESGTGKTLAAEVIAAHLGLDLYVIDLSTVVDKYIGETEKNLDRIFTEADRVNGVLLFDEADAIFGKRSEVRDARDRYANVEVAYLLQRMERFDGLAVLTTNLRANLDEAFTRRIDVIVDFPMPEDEARVELWRMHLPARLPQHRDLDLDFMARRFRLSGGNIRNICLTAAFLASDRDRPVEMADLIRGTEREYRKLGRLTVEAEFGQYHALLAAEAGWPSSRA